MRILTRYTDTPLTRRLVSHRRVLFIVALVGMIILIASPELKITRPAKAVFFATRSVATTGADTGDCTGGPCKTITYAVGQAAANDTINVAAGTYAEAVTIPAAKSGLLINGPNVNINACTGARVAEAIVGNATGAFNISANNVTLNGFTLQGNTSGAFFGYGVIIGANTSGVQLLNNIIQNNIAGVALGGDNSVIRGNLIQNNNNPGPASGHGIYTDQFVAGGTLSNVTIDNNCFVGNVSATPGTDGQALGFSSTDPASPATGITISSNTFTGNGRAFYMFNVTSSSFTRNTVSGSNFVGSADLRIFEGVNGLTITENSLSGGVADAMRISSFATPGLANATNITMSCNSITSYAGDGLEISAGAYTGPLTAENNWWGSATGPTIASNPGGTGETIVDPGAQVDYTPFLTSATDGAPAVTGFQCPVPPPPPPLTVTLQDPPVCTGPGSTVGVTAQVTNPNPTSQAATFTATLDPGLLALPGTCTATIGTCTVVNASTVTWSSPPPAGGLAAGQTVTITFQAQVANGTPPNAQLCINSTATVAGTSTTVQTCTTVNCPGVGPGTPPPAAAAVSDQKAGSVLFYNIYTSSLSDPSRQNTRINITNIDPARSIAVHLFFVDGSTCSPADSFICLTPSQTVTFLASDIDPSTTGYIVAVASDPITGCPVNFNFLIGDEFVKFSTGHAANLSAEAFAAIAPTLPCGTGTATLNFDGVSYNQVPRVLAVDNFPSPADGNNTLLILNRFGGDLLSGANSIGPLFGIIYNDAEQPFSFSIAGGNVCQLRNSLSNNFPRIVGGGVNAVISAGHSGWLRLWGTTDIGLLGAMINFNASAAASANAFNQGHNLHKLTLTSASLTIPIFQPAC